MPRVITNEEIKEACRKALADGTLLALNRPNGAFMYEARVRGKLCHCAIGAALTRKEISLLKRKRLNSECSVDGLVICEVVSFASFGFAEAVQAAHDTWACDDGARFRKLVEAA